MVAASGSLMFSSWPLSAFVAGVKIGSGSRSLSRSPAAARCRTDGRSPCSPSTRCPRDTRARRTRSRAASSCARASSGHAGCPRRARARRGSRRRWSRAPGAARGRRRSRTRTRSAASTRALCRECPTRARSRTPRCDRSRRSAACRHRPRRRREPSRDDGGRATGRRFRGAERWTPRDEAWQTGSRVYLRRQAAGYGLESLLRRCAAVRSRASGPRALPNDDVAAGRLELDERAAAAQRRLSPLLVLGARDMNGLVRRADGAVDRGGLESDAAFRERDLERVAESSSRPPGPASRA